MSNKATEIIKPESSGIFRVVTLYVGQGDTTIMAVPDGDDYKFVLIDSNHDEENGGIDLLLLLKDLLGDDGELDLYINTHPHKDHLAKVKQIYDEIGIKQLWHSGHKPAGDHKDSYSDLEYVIDQLGEENVFCLRGTREENQVDEKEVLLGDITYNVLAPADHVSDDIDGEKPEDRYRRIHEQCAVIRFKYGEDEKQILMTGDADYVAWKDHITNYHSERLPSTVLNAAHHGSNTFFWENTDADGDPYREHIDTIDPTYVIVSAPKSSESKHDHPHPEAMDEYRTTVGEEGLLHTGKNRECIIVDIDSAGSVDVRSDKELVEEYSTDGGGSSGSDGNAANAACLANLISSKKDPGAVDKRGGDRWG